MTFERQKKFLFISSKFQTPTDKVIKVSAETEGAQYLGGGGRGWGSVGSYLLFTKFLPHQPRPVCQLPGWGDLCQSLPNSLRNSYRRPTLTCVCQPPLSFSNVPLHSPNLLYLYFPVYLYLHLYLYICGSTPCLSQMCYCTTSNVFSAHMRVNISLPSPCTFVPDFRFATHDNDQLEMVQTDTLVL